MYTVLDVYQQFNALWLHFTKPEFDYFKYNGKTPLSKLALELRPDKYTFYQLHRKYGTQCFDLFLANFAYDTPQWVTHFTNNPTVVDHFQKYTKTKESCFYEYQKDLVYLENYSQVNSIPFHHLFKSLNGQHPLLLKLVLQHSINLETLLILNRILGFLPQWEKTIIENVLWPQLSFRYYKYSGFLAAKNLTPYTIFFQSLLPAIIENSPSYPVVEGSWDEKGSLVSPTPGPSPRQDMKGFCCSNDLIEFPKNFLDKFSNS